MDVCVLRVLIKTKKGKMQDKDTSTDKVQTENKRMQQKR
jgi:hypothetical protein